MTAMTVTGRTGTAHPGGTPALVVVAHGSRDPRALSTVSATVRLSTDNTTRLIGSSSLTDTLTLRGPRP